ncbi:hypothetical protein Scep_029803 [Stephania cephalantha]|uniref:Uncharacterized protein n=1 Tax=Stephania cephalantha TaxID=152367 RepID=A0AAP0E206_9MAGN
MKASLRTYEALIKLGHMKHPDQPFFFIADKVEDILQPKVTNTSETPPTVNDLYLHLHTVNHDGVTFIDTRSERFYAKLQMRRFELTQATPDQLVDDEAMYLNVAGECPKGRVYGLGSLGRKKRRYADPGASTSQMPEMVTRAEFDIVAEQLRKVMAFMHQQFGMTMEGAGLSQPQPPPPPPPPHDQQQPPQIDPADPQQQQDNVEREMQDWLTRDEHLVILRIGSDNPESISAYISL